MKRTECTKCRELQHNCNCDKKTIDWASPEYEEKIEGYDPRNRTPSVQTVDTTDKVS